MGERDMREIKFRFFDNHRSKMIIGDDLDITNCNVISQCLSSDEDYICMQFTGLKDKNNIEIFEGDIVKWGHANTYSSESFHRIAEVELFPSLQFRILWYFDTHKNCKKETDGHIFEFGRFSYKDTDKHLEVIGNIYQNKELLNES
ncbi:MAG: YopX family protein [Sulfurimonas sp.]|nr:YopX family protein [Sulfurimonas sp.]